MPRKLALRLVLALLAFATLATSAPRDPEIAASAAALIEAPAVVHVTVIGNAIAADHADDVDLTVSAGDQRLRFVPDNPALEVQESDYVALRDSVAVACQPTGPCEVGFSIELIDDQGTALESGSAEVWIDARFVRYADATFFNPQDRDFPEDATVEIVIDDE